MIQNNNLKIFAGMLITGFVTIIIALFSFSYSRSTEAYTTAVQNRERIAVIESQYKDIRERLDELKADIKILISNSKKGG